MNEVHANAASFSFFAWQTESPSTDCNAGFCSFLQDAYPQRLKQIHLFNVPNYIDKLLTLFRSLMKEKMRNRVSVCDLSLCILLRRRCALSLFAGVFISDRHLYPWVRVLLGARAPSFIYTHKARLAFFAAVATPAPSPRHQSGRHWIHN